MNDVIYNRRTGTSLYANTYILYHYWDENTDHSIITPARPPREAILYTEIRLSCAHLICDAQTTHIPNTQPQINFHGKSHHVLNTTLLDVY